MFKRKTTALFLLMATMVFLVGISVVSATSDNDTVIQDNSYSGIDQSTAEDNSDKLNEKYDNSATNSLKANSKQSVTTVTTEPTSTDRKIKITAEVKNSSGVLIKNSSFKLYCNNQLITTISTGSGLTRYYYAVPGTAEKATIKAVYQGNSVYASSSASHTNYVSKQNTKTTLKVEPTSVNNQIKITAEVRDKNNNLVQNSKFNIYYNGNLIKNIGTGSGITKVYYDLPSTNGNVTIKSVYQGSTLYKTSSNTYVGNPRKQDTKTTLKVEPTSVYNQIKITAEVRDKNNNLVQNSKFNIYYNGNLIKNIGTGSGITTFYYNAPNTYSDITIRSEYQGSANYYSSYATYSGKLPQKKETYTYLTVFKTDSKKIGINVEVTDTNYNYVKNSKFNIYYDGKLITTIGTSSGISRYYYTIPQQYSDYATISAKYLGNNLYKASEDSEVIYVPDYVYKTIELYTYSNFDVTTKYADGDQFNAWYQTYDGQWDKGVHIHIYPIDGTDMGDLPYNMLVDATFYFKNSAGNIISRQYDDGNGLWMSHSLISGYTPYKVVARYREMTQYEEDLWNSDYMWDPKTDEWHYYTYYYN